jgi:hypothetical protein
MNRPSAKSRCVSAVAGCFLAYGAAAHGDSWGAAKPRTLLSSNQAWSAAMAPGTSRWHAAMVVAPMSHPERGGGWIRQLVNRGAPVDFFVSDAGGVVTLGDWGSEGERHSVVIYDTAGKVVVDRTLEDFLTKDELARTERSVSSRHWRYHSEAPEFDGQDFTVMTAWGTTLRFDVRTGTITRDGGSFGRFLRYCAGLRPAREAVIYVSRRWKEGERYTGRHCEVRRTRATCATSGESYRASLATIKIGFDPRRFDRIVEEAAVAASYLGSDSSYGFDPSFVHVELVFGERITMPRSGAPQGGDTYWLKYRPSDVSPAAREWTARLEALVDSGRAAH